MKVLNREDLLFILSKIDDNLLYTEEDIKKIFELYGDDYFYDGYRTFEKVKENESMKNIRKLLY